MALAIVLACSTAQAKSPPSPKLPCQLPGEGAAAYLSLDPLPLAVKKTIARDFGDWTGHVIDMAPRDADYQESDLIEPGPRLSFHRFIQAGHAGSRWYIWYESGGEGSRYDFIIYEWRPGSAAAQQVATQSVWRDELCAETLKHWNDPPGKSGGG